MSGLLKYMQSFEFLFGIKLSKLLYCEVDKITTNLQGDKVCISNAMQFVSNLVETLEAKKQDFESFWTDVMGKRSELNDEYQNIPILQRYNFYTAIEEPLCPCASIRVLRQVHDTEEEAVKAYWYDHYVGTFETIVEDLRDRLNSPLIKVFVEIENLLLNSINSSLLPISIDLMDEAYGSKSNHQSAPLEGLNVDELKRQLQYLKTQWTSIKGNEEASSFIDIVHLVRESIKKETPLRHWEVNAKYVLTLLRLILVAAGTSTYAERAFSLSCRMITLLVILIYLLGIVMILTT